MPSVVDVVGPSNGFRYKDETGEFTFDAHPGTAVYCDYLQKIGIQLSESTINYAHECQRKIESINYIKELHGLFPELHRDYLREAKMI